MLLLIWPLMTGAAFALLAAAAAGNYFPSLNLFLFNKCIQVTIFTTSIIWLLNIPHFSGKTYFMQQLNENKIDLHVMYIFIVS